ncbi:MAG: protein translocase subunit SecF [Pseudanabaenaceae cyanobacterium bins.68]|nr:protein translocase subunit SecF [Pseudanabaenaceae cyanobacterium bins.68]
MKLEPTNFFSLDVIKHRLVYLSISLVAIAIGTASILFSWQTTGLPLKPALDFIGGTRLSYELVCSPTPTTKCGKPLEIAPIRQTMAAQGFKDLVIQLSGQDSRGLLVQTAKLGLEERSRIQTALSAAVSQYGVLDPAKLQIDEVGPVVGQQLLTSGLLALLISFIGIAIYLAVRFQPDYATFAIVALFHDVLITTGAFALLGLTLGVEVDSLFVVAMLTICGFSVNDTVIIYDRVRENLNSLGEQVSFNQIVNLSVNQSLARSINTSLTTVLPLITIFIFGGATLKYFALALIIGFAAGAYSSIFNATILLAWWRTRTN